MREREGEEKLGEKVSGGSRARSGQLFKAESQGARETGSSRAAGRCIGMPPRVRTTDCAHAQKYLSQGTVLGTTQDLLHLVIHV